jgi:hypothetical protein
MTKILFALGMATIPFSGIAGIGFLGELAPELSTYFFLPAVLIAIPEMAAASVLGHTKRLYLRTSTKVLTTILLLACGIAFISFMVNADSILVNIYQGRHAVEKCVSSFIVILYGFALSYFVFFVVGNNWERWILKPIAISALLCVVFSAFEILSRKFGLASEVFAFLDAMVHGGLNATIYDKGWDARIRSLAFEPPDLGNYVGFAWPWLISGSFFNSKRSKYGYALVWALLTTLSLYSGARTGFVMMGASTIILLSLRFIYLPSQRRSAHSISRSALTFLLLVVLLIGFLFGAIELPTYEQSVIAGSSVSDLSRLASIESAFNMFIDHPIFGLGLGQFGFFFAKYMPAWGHLSYEITAWLSDPPKAWPASYSVYARFASELGIVGLVAWIVLWFWLAKTVLIATGDYQKITGRVPAVSYPLITSCFCVLFSGLMTDTLRSPMIWITLGLSCRYLCEIATVAFPRKLARAINHSIQAHNR